MKASAQPPGMPSRLSDSVHYQLNMYALAASAAGVSVMALTQPAEAKIIYTPTYRTVYRKLPLDLNHDQKRDFLLKDFFGTFGTDTMWGGSLLVDPARQGNEVWGHKTGNYGSASALRAGVGVGPSGPFSGGPHIMAEGSANGGSCWGPWSNVKHRYLGLKFTSKGKTHFGWARLNVSCDPQRGEVSALLTGYAYETIPNKPIITGKTKGPDVITVQPGSLGRLAQGSAGRLAM